MTLEPARPGSAGPIVIVTALDEADLIGETFEALKRAFPEAQLVLADSGSKDSTAAIAERAGAEVRPSRFDGRQDDVPVGSRHALSVETEDDMRQRAHAMLRFMPR